MECHITKRLNIFYKLLDIGTVCTEVSSIFQPTSFGFSLLIRIRKRIPFGTLLLKIMFYVFKTLLKFSFRPKKHNKKIVQFLFVF